MPVADEICPELLYVFVEERREWRLSVMEAEEQGESYHISSRSAIKDL